MFGPTPIEKTLQIRQFLQKSASVPSIFGKLRPKEQVSFKSSASITSIPGLENIRVASPLPAITASTLNVEASMQPAAGAIKEPTSPTRSDAWLAILSGEHNVDIPFDKLGANSEAGLMWLCTEEEAKMHTKESLALRAKQKPTSGLSLPVPWMKQSDDALLYIKKVPERSGEALHFMWRAELCQHLQEHGSAHGPRALAAALAFRIGRPNLHVLDVNRDGLLGFIDFAAMLSMLNLDADALCCAAEPALMKHLAMMDHNTRNLRLGIPKLLGPGKAEICGEIEPETELTDAQAKWTIVGRWMGSASLRSAALRRDREGRGWLVRGAEPGSQRRGQSAESRSGQSAESRSGGQTSFVTGLSEATSSSHVAIQRTFAEILLETAASLRAQDYNLRTIFASSASLYTAKTGVLMSRQDVVRFFADLHFVDERVAQRVDEQVINRLFDEAMHLQETATKIKGGLIFWSFKAILNNIIQDLDLGWSRLVEHLTDIA